MKLLFVTSLCANRVAVAGLVVGDESRLEESLKECIEEHDGEGEGEDTANSSEVFKEESLNTILANENLLGRYRSTCTLHLPNDNF
jgi:hypothetical protein